MRILRVAQKVYPDVTGGAPYHIHALSKAQGEMGHDVTVLTVRYVPGDPHIEERDGYTLVRYGSQLSPLGNDISTGLTHHLLRTNGYDVVHAHSHLYSSTNVAAVKRHVSGVPLALTNHGLYSQTAPLLLQEAYLKTLGKWTFNSADVIFCYTDGEKQRVRERGIESPIEVISNGIDHRRFTPDGPTSDLVSTDAPVVLSVNRLVDGKRPRDAIDAVARLRETVPDVRLVMTGDGYLRGELERYVADRGLNGTVTFLGDVAYDEMPRLYRSCDVFLLASGEEAGEPRVVLEAMASAKPFVLTNITQTNERLREMGMTAPVGDPAALAAALETLLVDRERGREVGAAGRRLVEEEFDWQSTAEETTRWLERIVER